MVKQFSKILFTQLERNRGRFSCKNFFFFVWAEENNHYPLFFLTGFITVLTTLTLAPYIIFANGGDQRIVEGKYYINLSRAPFTSRVGDKTQMLASFVDLQTNKLVSEDMAAKIRISKLGGSTGKREFVYEQDNIKVAGGILDFSYTFKDTGLHEIFFDFSLASNPDKVFEAPDFLLDIQKPEVSEKPNRLLASVSIFGVMLAFMGGLFIGRKIKAVS